MSAELVAAIDRLTAAIITRGSAPELIDASKLAVMLDISERQVHRLDDGGKLPGALELGGCKRWRIAEIRAWLVAGAPPRAAWKNLRSAVADDRRSEAVLFPRRN